MNLVYAYELNTAQKSIFEKEYRKLVDAKDGEDVSDARPWEWQTIFEINISDLKEAAYNLACDLITLEMMNEDNSYDY